MLGPGVSYTGVFYGGVAVFDFDNINIGPGVTLNAVGTLPVAFLSRGNIFVSGMINVSGGNAMADSLGGGMGGAGGGGGGPGGTFRSSPSRGVGPGGDGVAVPGGLDGGGGGFGGNGSPGDSGLGGFGGMAYGNLATMLQGGSGGGGGGSDYLIFAAAAVGAGAAALNWVPSGCSTSRVAASLPTAAPYQAHSTVMLVAAGPGAGSSFTPTR